MKHIPLPETANRELLQKLSDALHNPTVLPDFSFDMMEQKSCVHGFLCAIGLHEDIESLIWNFCNLPVDHARWICASNWRSIDNSREGAALRIDYLLENGLPDDYPSQATGRAKLCYR